MKSRSNKYNIICTTLGATIGVVAGMTVCVGGIAVIIESPLDLDKASLFTQYACLAGTLAPIPILGIWGGKKGLNLAKYLANRNPNTKPPFWNSERTKILNNITAGAAYAGSAFMLGSVLYVKVNTYVVARREQRKMSEGIKKLDSKVFNQMVLHEYKKRFTAPNLPINWSQKFSELKYETHLENIDCRTLPKEVVSWLEKTEFTQFTFTGCYLPPALYRKCLFTNCQFVNNSSSLTNCVVIAENQSASSALQQLRYQLKRCNNLVINKYSAKPIVILVYVKSHGTLCTDKMITRLKERGMDVCQIDSSELYGQDQNYIPDHPMTKVMHQIDGIVLPGGHDIIADKSKYTHREKLELYLYKQSLKYEIPLYAVCRGHQFVGAMLGGEVVDLDRFDHKHRIIVTPDKDNFLYHLVDKKYASQTRKELSKQITKQDEVISYHGSCQHHQHVLFKNDIKSQQTLVTAISEDGIVEGLQVRHHIITFQHHHETYSSLSNRLSKAVLKHYTQMIISYHQAKKDSAKHSMVQSKI